MGEEKGGGLYLDANVSVRVNGCTFVSGDYGALVKRGHLDVSDSAFGAVDQPVDFDGGGNLSMLRNIWSKELVGDQLKTASLKPEDIEFLVWRIVERHYER